ncbi:MAG: CPBP family intramembrane metalloprotease [Rhodobacteraceae bacterium]|nr:CPBP family intramembrane metalloprotease [Paracoccaceae bacterium]
MNDAFSRFVAPARPPVSWWRPVAALVCMVVVSIIGSVLVPAIAAAVQGITGPMSLERIFAQGAVALATLHRPVSVLLLLGTFVFWFCAVLAATCLFHKRGLRSLTGPWPGRRVMAVTSGIIVILAIGAAGSAVLADRPAQNMRFATWLGYMPVALPLLLIQVTAEELIFRGYLLQELAVRYQAPLVWWVLPAAVFGLVHYQGETFGSNAWLIVGFAFFMGLVLADITVRTGSLLPAVILHFANNFVAMMLVALDGTVTGLSLFISDIHVSDETAVRGHLLQGLAVAGVLYAFWLAWHWRCAGLHGRPAPHKSASDIDKKQP